MERVKCNFIIIHYVPKHNSTFFTFHLFSYSIITIKHNSLLTPGRLDVHHPVLPGDAPAGELHQCLNKFHCLLPSLDALLGAWTTRVSSKFLPSRQAPGCMAACCNSGLAHRPGDSEAQDTESAWGYVGAQRPWRWALHYQGDGSWCSEELGICWQGCQKHFQPLFWPLTACSWRFCVPCQGSWYRRASSGSSSDWRRHLPPGSMTHLGCRGAKALAVAIPWCCFAPSLHAAHCCCRCEHLRRSHYQTRLPTGTCNQTSP